MTTLQTPPETDATTDEEIAPIPSRPKVGRWVLFGAMVVVAAVMLYPFWVMIGESLESETQFLGSGGFSWLSWSGLTSVIPVGQEILSSTIVCAASIAIILAVGLPAGFAFAKLRFRASTTVFLIMVSAMMVPLQAILMPEYVNISSKLHLSGGYLGAILVYAALGTPFSVFLFSTYFRGVPDELIEAGIVDGLGYFGALFRLVVPVAIPAIATVTVLQFIQIWDDLLVGLLFIQNPDERPITVGLAILAAGRTTSIPELMAGSLLSALPAMIVYLVFQRYLVKGLTMGIDR
jgi:ABC-type glycerol-3-phosphate transport system permease component